MKFTDEEWSRILSAHAGGLLINGGVNWLPWRFEPSNPNMIRGCVNQFAYNSPWRGDAIDFNREVAKWFDHGYSRTMTIGKLIAGIDSVSK
jgi:hypothetical protein